MTGFNKKVLVISNNVFSDQNNNGKTLLSFFKKLPKENLAQIYFSSEVANINFASKFFRISDNDILKSQFFLQNRALAGCEPVTEDRRLSSKGFAMPVAVSTIKGSDFIRLVRESLWRSAKINHQLLSKWVHSFDPDVVFFCAGDSGFAYDIYNRVCSLKPSAKKVVYVTDDYILPRRKISPFWWIRRKMVYEKMKRAASESKVFLTISAEMRESYRNLLGKDSINIFNMASDLSIKGFKKTPRADLIFVYAGGLHFERWKALKALGRAIERYNKKRHRSVCLKIFSHQHLGKDIFQKLSIPGASEFCGSLASGEVAFELNDADILVHVESFSRYCMESTRLSISTKIAEYLSVNKPILAMGPNEVASMRFLENAAICINSLKQLDQKLEYAIDNAWSCDRVVLQKQMTYNQRVFESEVLS
jgi:hypothetical protein